MINWSLSGDPLIHCLSIAGAKLLMVDEEQGCQDRVQPERQKIEEELHAEIFTLSKSLKIEIAEMPVVRPNDAYRSNVQGNFPAALIYTRFDISRDLPGLELSFTVAGLPDFRRLSRS